MGLFDWLPSRKKKEANMVQRIAGEVVHKLTEADKVKPKGFASVFSDSLSSDSGYRALSTAQLRFIYKSSNSVRRAADNTARQVAKLQYSITPPEGTEEGTEIDKDAAKLLFTKQNLSGESFRDVILKVVIDLLIINKAAIYIARNPYGVPKQLYARDASLITPIYDKTGVLIRYDMTDAGRSLQTGPIESFLPHELIYIDTFPKTYVSASEPVIEAVSNEIAFLLNLPDRAAYYARKDRMPQGFLQLGKIDKDAYSRAREVFETSSKGMKVVDNVEHADWKTIGDPLAQAFVLTFDMFDKLVAKTFGFNPSDTDFVGQSTLVHIIALIIQDQLNEYLSETLRGVFTYTLVPALDTRGLGIMVRSGIMTPNDARRLLGLPPVEGGDVLGILAPTGLEQLKELPPSQEEGPLPDDVEDSLTDDQLDALYGDGMIQKGGMGSDEPFFS